MSTLCIGIDLNAKTPDKVIVTEGPGEVLHEQEASKKWDDLSDLLETVQQFQDPDDEMVVVLEATGMAWFPVSVFFDQHEVPIYRIKGQRSKDLRKFLEKHAKTDPIDARALTMVYYLIPDKLYSLEIPSNLRMKLKDLVNRRETFVQRLAAEKNRLQADIKWMLPGLSGNTSQYTNKKMHEIIARAVNFDWMNEKGETPFYSWAQRHNGQITPEESKRIFEASNQARKLYKTQSEREVYYSPQDREEKIRECLEEMAHLEEKIEAIEEKLKEHNKELLSDKPLQSIYGTGKVVEWWLKAYLGDGSQFPNLSKAQAYVAYIPKTDNSGETDKKGTRIRKDGPSGLKSALYNAVDTARQWDPQIAQKYHNEMVNKGNAHVKAICNCVNKYLARVMRVLRTGDPYELRDCDGNPIEAKEARHLIKTKYTVPEEVRKRLRNRDCA